MLRDKMYWSFFCKCYGTKCTEVKKLLDKMLRNQMYWSFQKKCYGTKCTEVSKKCTEVF